MRRKGDSVLTGGVGVWANTGVSKRLLTAAILNVAAAAFRVAQLTRFNEYRQTKSFMQTPPAPQITDIKRPFSMA
jgi:hypothetical protein